MLAASQLSYVAELLHSFYSDRPKQPPSEWCCQSLRFDEPGNNGPFSLAGREYTREILDSQADPLVSDEVLVFGSQAGKTSTVMGKAAWTVRNSPSRIFWVMPTRDTVQKFSRTRWAPMLRASPELCELIPVGSRRHDFSTFQQILRGAIIDFVWSNSPAALASIPAPVVILDEVDKFDEGGRREANAVELANQRTKSFAVPKRIKTSTPTLTEGLIWQEFLKTDQRRRYLPCPHCQKFILLVWSKAFTAFKSLGCEAEIRWAPEAKRKDGSWDLDRVERSAHAVCPHCGGHILDAHKTLMDRNGEWRPTAPAARGYRGWHLSSLYAASAEVNFGKLAVKFLQAKQSLLGLQGFINGDLAEPYESQDTHGERIEIVTEALAAQIADQCKIMFVDVQKDCFWFVVQIYGTTETKNEAGATVRRSSVHHIDAGQLLTWEDVRAKQLEHGIIDPGVVIDSGDRTKGSGDSVYLQCARFSKVCPPRKGGKPTLIGWTPSKGMPAYKRWRTPEGVYAPYYLRPVDPYDGTTKAGVVEIGLFEFSGDFFKDILAAMRAGRGEILWSVEKQIATEDWWRHLDAERKQRFFNKRTGRSEEVWIKKGRDWPNHMLDCVVGGHAYAAYLGKLKVA